MDVDVLVDVEEEEDVVVVEDGQLFTILQNMFNKDWLEEIAENTACAIASGHNFESIFCKDNVRGSQLATSIQGNDPPVLNTRSVLVLWAWHGFIPQLLGVAGAWLLLQVGQDI